MGAPLADLLTAIESLWATNKAASGGLQVFTEAQFGEKSPAAAKGHPYCVIGVDASRLAVVTSLTQIYEHEVLFSIYDATLSGIKTRAGVIENVFLAGFSALADSGLSLAEGTLVAVRPIGSMLVREDRSVYRWDIRIGFQTSKSRADNG